MVTASRSRFDELGHRLSFLVPASQTSGCSREHSESLLMVSQGWGIGQSPDIGQEHRAGTSEDVSLICVLGLMVSSFPALHTPPPVIWWYQQ